MGRLGSKFKEMVNISLEMSERLMAARLNEREAELLFLQSKIISFILQPFVENAMYHGLEPKMGSGTIRLTGWKDSVRSWKKVSLDWWKGMWGNSIGAQKIL